MMEGCCVVSASKNIHEVTSIIAGRFRTDVGNAKNRKHSGCNIGSDSHSVNTSATTVREIRHRPSEHFPF
jgi:hypothetical protein